MSPGRQVDATVVGAGMVGCAAALSLANNGYQVALIEASVPARWNKAEYSLRVSAISAASESLLETLGVWNAIADLRVSPYQHMHVWDASGNGCLDFDAADSGRANLGYIVENDLITTVLLEQLQQMPNVQFDLNMKVSAIDQDDEQALVCLEDGCAIKTGLVIAADGASSFVRQLAGVGCTSRDYRQQGIVVRVKSEYSHESTAWQRFLSTGPLAFLPLGDGSCSIVWSADNEYAEQLMALDEQEFAKRLAVNLECRLGAVELLSARAAFPLTLSNADSYAVGRVLLLGDAAHRVHPLAGQGVNLGFQDVIHLASTLDEARRNDRDLADPMYLRKFARERRAEAALMIAGMDGIQRIFATDRMLVTRSRNLAMQLIDRIPLLKQFFVDRALGN